MIVLDTNVVSEPMRPRPSAAVLDWFARQPARELVITAVTEAELRYGLTLIDPGRRRDALAAALEATIAKTFAGRVLPFDGAAARAYAEIAAARRATGRPIAQADCQIAATAQSRGAALATRNVADFTECGVTLINPWTDIAAERG